MTMTKPSDRRWAATGAVDPGRSLEEGLPREATAAATVATATVAIATAAGGVSAEADTRRRETGDSAETEAATEVGGYTLHILLP